MNVVRQQIENNFVQTQHNILGKELGKLIKLRTELISKATVIDEKAREKQHEEINKIQLIETKLKVDNDTTNSPVSIYQAKNVNLFEKDFKTKKADLLKQIEYISTSTSRELTKSQQQIEELIERISKSVE